MSKGTKIAVVTISLTLGLALLGPLAWVRFERWAVGIHQRSVKNSLAGWEREFEKIRSKKEAFRAIDMLRYAQRYYVPGPGYRGSPDTESALEGQRQQTLATIAKALEEFTGKDYGLDIAKWEAWRDGQQRD